jgi:hypothetical protein
MDSTLRTPRSKSKTTILLQECCTRKTLTAHMARKILRKCTFSLSNRLTSRAEGTSQTLKFKMRTIHKWPQSGSVATLKALGILSPPFSSMWVR